jgi:hypothetical protein
LNQQPSRAQLFGLLDLGEPEQPGVERARSLLLAPRHRQLAVMDPDDGHRLASIA